MAASSSTRFSATKLSPALGASISGVDLRNPTAQDIRDIKQAFADYSILIFREQFLSPEQELAFGKIMGEIISFDGLEAAKDLPPGIIRLSNDGLVPKLTENWHSDTPYMENPSDIGLLYAHTIPSVGGDTMWSNLYAAYDSLSDGMKALIEGLRCHCESTRLTKRMGHSELLSAIKPIVRTHPVTGRRHLFIGNPDAFINFVGMTREESEPLIRYLYTQAYQPNLVYRHKWQLGDVVMWDNRSTLHYAIYDYGTEPRVMHRIPVRCHPGETFAEA